MASSHKQTSRVLPFIDVHKHEFIVPVKRIIEGQDVPFFLNSRAYMDIGLFITQLNTAMCPKSAFDGAAVKTWEIDSPAVEIPPTVQSIQLLLEKIGAIIEEVPPDPGPRRFGNISYREWSRILESRLSGLLDEHLPKAVLSLTSSEGTTTAKDELMAYLLGGFGSAQRLDYGTGHELSFLAFLGGIWKLKGFHATTTAMPDGAIERSIVLGVIEPYLRVIRRLILTYTLEPAGSHGVWGLDDHFFLSYIFGSAQYCPAIKPEEVMPLEGSLPRAPSPGQVTNKKVVDSERKSNMYFSAIGFIYDVKTGPFWEHSPILFDISGVRAGWGKINKGMIKMFNAEVLSKFPVVQHFPFGSLFMWEQDPNATVQTSSVHTESQPLSQPISVSSNIEGTATSRPLQQEGTKAPWATADSRPPVPSSRQQLQEGMRAPRTNNRANEPMTAAPWAVMSSTAAPQSAMLPPIGAPWANRAVPGSGTAAMPMTRAPWSSGAPPNSQGPVGTPQADLSDRASQSRR